jgi:hypothetical protein
MDTLVLVVVSPHFAALHLVSRLHDARVARTTPLCLSSEPLMLCSHAGTFTSRSASLPALCPLSGISISRPTHDLVTMGLRRQRPLFSLPYRCPSVSFHASCLTLSNRAHTHTRVRDVDAARGTAPPSRLCRPGLCPCRDCVAVLLALAVVAEPPALTHANPVVAFHTSSETKASRS